MTATAEIFVARGSRLLSKIITGIRAKNQSVRTLDTPHVTPSISVVRGEMHFPPFMVFFRISFGKPQKKRLNRKTPDVQNRRKIVMPQMLRLAQRSMTKRRKKSARDNLSNRFVTRYVAVLMTSRSYDYRVVSVGIVIEGSLLDTFTYGLRPFWGVKAVSIAAHLNSSPQVIT